MSGDAAGRLRAAAERVNTVLGEHTLNPWSEEDTARDREIVALSEGLAAAVLALLDGHGESCDAAAPWSNADMCEVLMGGQGHECPLVAAATLLPDDAP